MLFNMGFNRTQYIKYKLDFYTQTVCLVSQKCNQNLYNLGSIFDLNYSRYNYNHIDYYKVTEYLTEYKKIKHLLLLLEINDSRLYIYKFLEYTSYILRNMPFNSFSLDSELEDVRKELLDMSKLLPTEEPEIKEKND